MQPFEDNESFRRFFEYAKLANPPFNPSVAFLFLLDKMNLIERKMFNLQGKIEDFYERDEPNALECVAKEIDSGSINIGTAEDPKYVKMSPELQSHMQSVVEEYKQASIKLITQLISEAFPAVSSTQDESQQNLPSSDQSEP